MDPFSMLSTTRSDRTWNCNWSIAHCNRRVASSTSWNWVVLLIEFFCSQPLILSSAYLFENWSFTESATGSGAAGEISVLTQSVSRNVLICSCFIGREAWYCWCTHCRSRISNCSPPLERLAFLFLETVFLPVPFFPRTGEITDTIHRSAVTRTPQ